MRYDLSEKKIARAVAMYRGEAELEAIAAELEVSRYALGWLPGEVARLDAERAASAE